MAPGVATAATGAGEQKRSLKAAKQEQRTGVCFAPAFAVEESLRQIRAKGPGPANWPPGPRFGLPFGDAIVVEFGTALDGDSAEMKRQWVSHLPSPLPINIECQSYGPAASPAGHS